MHWPVLVCWLAMLALTAADLDKGAEASWLLMVEAGQGEAERRITQKSIFIGPQLGPRAHRCKDGYRYNHVGECVRVARPSTSHLDSLLLHRLRGGGKPSAGPLHFSLPLSSSTDTKPTEPATKVVMSESPGAPSVTTPSDVSPDVPTLATTASPSESSPVVTTPVAPSGVSSALDVQRLSGTGGSNATSHENVSQTTTLAPDVEGALDLFLQRLRVTAQGNISAPHQNDTDSLNSLDLLLKQLRGDSLITEENHPQASPLADRQREDSVVELSDESATTVPLLEELALEQHLPLMEADQPIENEAVATRSAEDTTNITTTEQANVNNVTTAEDSDENFYSNVDSSTIAPETIEQANYTTERNTADNEDFTTLTLPQDEMVSSSTTNLWTTEAGFIDDATDVWLPYVSENITRTGYIDVTQLIQKNITENIKNETDLPDDDHKMESISDSDNLELSDDTVTFYSTIKPQVDSEGVENGSSLLVETPHLDNKSSLSVSSQDTVIESVGSKNAPLRKDASSFHTSFYVSSIREVRPSPSAESLPQSDFKEGEDVILDLYPTKSSVESSRLVSSSSVQFQSSTPNPAHRYFPNSRFSIPTTSTTRILPSSSDGDGTISHSSLSSVSAAVADSRRQKPYTFFPEDENSRSSAHYRSSKPISFFPYDGTNFRHLGGDTPKQFFPGTSSSIGPVVSYPSPLSFGTQPDEGVRYRSSSTYDSPSHSYSTSVSGFDSSSGAGTGPAFYSSHVGYESLGSQLDYTGSGYEPSTSRFTEGSGESVVPPILLFEELVANLYNKTASRVSSS